MTILILIVYLSFVVLSDKKNGIVGVGYSKSNMTKNIAFINVSTIKSLTNRPEILNSSDFPILDNAYPSKMIDIRISKSNTIYQVEVVSTPALRNLGLSHRSSLAPSTGLLFVFEEEGYYPFWMKDMNFPIDIIWLNKEKKIVHIEASVFPSTYPLSFVSTEPALYVLEIPAGSSNIDDIHIGDNIHFDIQK